MQSSANMQLSPEEDTTVSVSANDFGDGVEAGLCVVGMPWLAVCDCDESIPIPSIKEVDPGVF